MLSNSGYESEFHPILQILRMVDDESNCVDNIRGVASLPTQSDNTRPRREEEPLPSLPSLPRPNKSHQNSSSLKG